jgi:hypothetical protein
MHVACSQNGFAPKIFLPNTEEIHGIKDSKNITVVDYKSLSKMAGQIRSSVNWEDQRDGKNEVHARRAGPTRTTSTGIVVDRRRPSSKSRERLLRWQLATL